MPALLTYIRFHLFQAIEWMANYRKKPFEAPLRLHHFSNHLSDTSSSDRYLWVFASTIGELHAIQPLLTRLLAQSPFKGLVILTDHPLYTDAFLKVFPQAAIIDHGLDGKVTIEIARYLPSLFILAEIPCLLSDAPCRFSYRVIFELKKRGVPIVAANAWLYGEKPSCRMDEIERTLLHKDYLQAIDLFTVQNEDISARLIAAGVAQRKVVVTGNIKFDAVIINKKPLVRPKSLDPLMDSLEELHRPCIVAGCITNLSEQEYVLDAFAQVLEQLPQALLILAPRHPENNERMAKLVSLLQDRGLLFLLRSQFEPNDLGKVSVVVLDTIGELRYLYASGDVCFVGLNHNVLEPLALNKPVFVSYGWEKTYPSYSVYQETKRLDLIVESQQSSELASQLVKKLITAKNSTVESLDSLQALCGASSHNEKLIMERFMTKNHK